MSERNFAEYRDSVLEKLGAEGTNVRNTREYRAAVLDALGAEYEDEDTVNFERWRVKVLDNLGSGGGGGGGGGSNTATVQVNYTLPESVSSVDDLQFNSSTVTLEYGNNSSSIYYVYASYGLPFSELGSVTEMKIPLHEGCKTNITGMQYQVEGVGLFKIDKGTSSVVSGDAEIIGNKIYVWGDCVLNLALTNN